MLSGKYDAVRTLAPREVHLWSADLNRPADSSSLSSLSADELTRAAGFRFERERARFIAGRVTLRRLCAEYLSTEPSQIAFSYGAHGKPELLDNATGLHFNMSHSSDLALYAFALAQPVGVDVEHERPIAGLEAITRRFFSAAEHDAIQRLPPEERERQFFIYWARKEAFLKATGHGMSMSLNQVVVDGTDARAGWTFHDLIPAPGYVAAIAVEGADFRIRDGVRPAP